MKPHFTRRGWSFWGCKHPSKILMEATGPSTRRRKNKDTDIQGGPENHWHCPRHPLRSSFTQGTCSMLVMFFLVQGASSRDKFSLWKFTALYAISLQDVHFCVCVCVRSSWWSSTATTPMTTSFEETPQLPCVFASF